MRGNATSTGRQPNPLWVLLVAASLGCSPATANGGRRDVDSPPAVGAAPAFAIDSAQLLADVSALAADSMEGRLAGSEGAARARRYIIGRLQRVGADPATGGSYEQPPFALSNGEPRGVNVVARIAGRSRPDQYLVVSAHYDHLGVRSGQIFNGADDNASGAGVLLALAAELTRNPPESSVLLAFFDAEEGGLRGARAFVAAPPVPLARIVLNVNMDMVSRNAQGELYAAGTSHYPFLRPHLDTVAARAPVVLRFGHDRPSARATDDWTKSSDHAAFHGAGVPFVYFGVEDHPDYHRPSDDVERIDAGFYLRVVRTVADAVTTLDRALPAIAVASGRQP